MNKIIEFVNGRGCDPKARDLRDAAHEAVHALLVEDARGKPLRNWNRDAVHRALKRSLDRSEVAMSEVLARVVEARVCAHFGVEYKKPEGWIFISFQEAYNNGTAWFNSSQCDQAFSHCAKSTQADKMTARIIALAGDEVQP